MERYDAVVIGGGPAGTTAAMQLAMLDWRTVVIESRTAGDPKPCGHCLSPRGVQRLRNLDLEPPLSVGVGRTVRLRLYVPTATPTTRILDIDLGGEPGVVVDRRLFDPWLIEQAQQAGVTVWQPARATVIAAPPNPRVDIVSSCGQTSITAAIVVGADGLGSRVARALGLAHRARSGGAYGFSFDFKCDRITSLETDAVHMFTSEAGYLGVVRSGSGKLHVGALVRKRTDHRAPTAFIERMTEAHAILEPFRLQDNRRWESFASIGPMPWRVRSVASNVGALVGDAAGYVEPFTGEGLTWAFESAECLAESIGAARPGTWNEAAAGRYRALWARRVRRRQIFCSAAAWLLQHPRLFGAGVRFAAYAPAASSRLAASRVLAT